MRTSSQVHFSRFLGWSYPTDHLKFTTFLPPFAAGAIPESLGNLVELLRLDLSGNKLEGLFLSFLAAVTPD
jgi:hypothetical protein